MLKKFDKNLIGLKKEIFDSYIKSSPSQLRVQPARLIPALKTGDEMALTSIFLSTIRLVKEYRDSIFKEIKLSRSGKVYYYTEVSFPDINDSRIDGLIIVVIKGVIVDAAFFEMKNKSNGIDKAQIESYIEISKRLKVTKLVTISNEFVSDPAMSPIKVKVPKSISLFHFSWTYLMTKGQLLLFKNDHNIEDEDQVEIMAETLHYFENPSSGISGYNQMKKGWNTLAENIRGQKTLKQSDEYIEEAVISWYEEEKDIALIMSRKLGVLVKPSIKNKDSLKKDIKKIVNENCINGLLNIKNAVSDIKITVEFERQVVYMSNKIIPPLDRGTIARISWVERQIDNFNKKDEIAFQKVEKEIWIEADIKYAKANIKVKLSDLESLVELTKGKEIQAFHLVLARSFGKKFEQPKNFITQIEKMILEYYKGIVQYAKSWNRPTPKIVND
jgi:hypothetical protein